MEVPPAPCILTHRGQGSIKVGIKQWRLIMRNLPFNTTVEQINELATGFGHVIEVNLPKCKDKRYPNSCAGFCFVQFARRCDAESAQKALNFSEFNGRKIAVDWSLEKDAYVTITSENASSKALKSNNMDDFDSISSSSNINELQRDIKPQNSLFANKIGNEETSEIDSHDCKTQCTEPIRIRREDPAIAEGRVIFLKNLPFDAENEHIKKVASNFGEVALAILCKNPDTCIPNGSAFVHFKERHSADDFLNHLLKGQVQICSRNAYGHRAVSRSEAASFNNNRDKQTKDKRNLFLLRVSLIRPGTAQANDMSENDAKSREKLVLAAKNKLKNLLMFVSPTRLVVHNIPFPLKDAELKLTCAQSAKCELSNITECKIMRQKKGISPKGRPLLGRSKGFAFVAFKEHAQALACIKHMNNNPETFTNERRPIVEFSIESINAIKLKENRLNKSLRNQDDPELIRTKQTIMKSGKKYLPKRLGPKNRQLKKKNKKKKFTNND